MEATAEYRYLSLADFAAAVGISERRVLHLIEKRKITALRPGPHAAYKILESEVDRYRSMLGDSGKAKARIPLKRHEKAMRRYGRLLERFRRQRQELEELKQQLATVEEQRLRLERDHLQLKEEMAALRQLPWWKRLFSPA